MRDASNHPARPHRTLLRAGVTALCIAAACALALLAAAPAGGAATSGAFAMASDGGGQTIAFESIDGPPPGVFDRMVSVLDSETKLRSLRSCRAKAPAAYRVRSYLSAQIVHGRTQIAWVWDVYDRDQQRALRLSGTELGGKAGARCLGCRRRHGVAQDRAGGPVRPLRHGQRHAGRCAAAGARPRPGKRGPAVASMDPPATTGGSNIAALGYTDH